MVPRNRNTNRILKCLIFINKGVIVYKDFEEFIFNVIDMYHQTLSQKIQTERESIKKKFYEITEGKNKLTYKSYK